ncbi:hypothetical protein ACNKW1_06535 [Thauera sp. WH-2]|jgi:hypothetical protein|uniref:hypothetical protein n=1 Tax=Thauera sp. WH-2 TaxID=3401574 RepID=UPI002A45062D|nr:hypothetical protein [FCB group bacterium]
MRRTLYVTALTSLLWPFAVAQAKCEVPPYEEFEPRPVLRRDSGLTAVELSLPPVATVRIPAGFFKWGIQPDGSVAFGKHPNGISGGIGYETRETVSVHKEGLSPADFVLSIFHGLDETGCAYLEGFGLREEDYRLHASLGSAAELFAFGKGDRHHFYLVRRDRPDFVLNALFRGIDRSEFEAILSTLKLVSE